MKIFKNWGVHNIVAHPLMQILAWLGMPVAALRVHDATLPQAHELGDATGDES